MTEKARKGGVVEFSAQYESENVKALCNHVVAKSRIDEFV